jgi:hypothetical protein
MSEYTPTTEEVRTDYVLAYDERQSSQLLAGAAFDRWLIEHDRQVEIAVIEKLDVALGLLADAREALETFSDRIEEHVYSELASPLFDAPLDEEGRDMVALVLAKRREGENDE